MILRSGAFLLAIFLSLSIATAIDDSGGLEEDYLSYGLERSSSSSVVYTFSSGTDSDEAFRYSQYVEYYSSGEDEPPDFDLQSFETFGNTPSILHMGSQSIPYADYKSQTLYSDANTLWIEGETSWTQYAICPQGSWLKIMAVTPSDGIAYFYEITPSSRVNLNQYSISSYNRMSFYAEEHGRYFLFFVNEKGTSNLVMVDVGPWSTSEDVPPEPTPSPTPTPVPVPTPAPTSTLLPTPTIGDVKVTVKSEGMIGYDVYIDDVYVGKDGIGGDALDGVYNLRLIGGQWHTVKVYDGEWFYGKPKYYAKGSTHTLYVEPATTVYIYGGR